MRWLSVCLCRQVGPRFEVVVFTASLAKYADPLLDLMDKVCGWGRVWQHEGCVFGQRLAQGSHLQQSYPKQSTLFHVETACSVQPSLSQQCTHRPMLLHHAGGAGALAPVPRVLLPL